MKKNPKGPGVRDSSTQYVFLDTKQFRNLRDERKVSSEFHKMMRHRKYLDETYESRFVKTLQISNRNDAESTLDNLSIMVDVDTSEFSSVNMFDLIPRAGTSKGSESWSNGFSRTTYVEEIDGKSKVYLSRSHESIYAEQTKLRNNKHIKKSPKKRVRSEDNITYRSIRNQCTDYHSGIFYTRECKGRANSHQDTKEKACHVKRNKKSTNKNNILSFFERVSKYFERLVGWKCASKANSAPTDEESKYSSYECNDTEMVTTVYQISAAPEVLSQEPSSSQNQIEIRGEDKIAKTGVFSTLKNFYATSFTLPRKWFTMSSRSAHSTGELIRHPFAYNRRQFPMSIELPDKKRLVDISRGYYPLTKWNLLDRLFRQKHLNNKLADAISIGQGDRLTTNLNGSVKEGQREDGNKTDAKAVSLSEVKVEEGNSKAADEKRSQDDDEDECGSGWGYWIEYLLVLLVSVILLLGCVFLVLFWCFYYKKGYNSWKVERDQQFNLHPTLMVGAVVFTGFSVLMYRIGRCSRRLYVKLLHATFHLLAILCFVGGFLSIFEWHNMTNLTHFYSLHSWIGFITMGLFGVQFLVGFVSFLVLLCCESATAGFRACLLPLHTTFGLAIFLISIATCLTGLVQRTNSTIGEENYPSLPEEAIVVNALGVALVAVGVAVTYALGRNSLRCKSDCYISERL